MNVRVEEDFEEALVIKEEKVHFLQSGEVSRTDTQIATLCEF